MRTGSGIHAEISKSKCIKISKDITGSTTIINDFYVDDLLSGSDSIDEVKILRDETIQILEQGRFQLRKWASNCPEVLEDLSYTSVNEPVHFINKDNEICTLDMHWNVRNDEFRMILTFLRLAR